MSTRKLSTKMKIGLIALSICLGVVGGVVAAHFGGPASKCVDEPALMNLSGEQHQNIQRFNHDLSNITLGDTTADRTLATDIAEMSTNAQSRAGLFGDYPVVANMLVAASGHYDRAAAAISSGNFKQMDNELLQGRQIERNAILAMDTAQVCS